jgi:WD40 repeat protein
MPQQTTLAGGTTDGNIYLWDVIGLTIQRIMGGHTGPVRSLVHTTDGEILFSGSSDNTVRIWNVSSGAPLGSFQVTGIVNSLAISSDGTILAMGSEDGVLRLWGLAP